MNARPIVEGLRGEWSYDEPMSRHTSWRVGGPADRYYRPADLDDLIVFMSRLPPQEPLHWVGLGSNLLVRDGGIRGTVVAPTGALVGLALVGELDMRTEVGVTCAKAARFSVNHGLSGAEFLAGIPGTVGGALAMNAGAFGGETWQVAYAADTINRRGQIVRHARADLDIGYRHVGGLRDEWFVAGYFRLRRDSAAAGRERIKALLGRRGDSQPTQFPTAGSVFKNPPGDHAARLIDAAGLKGTCIGGACVSAMHANFIVNTGHATAADVEALIAQVREVVAHVHQVRLEPEVRIVGETL